MTLNIMMDPKPTFPNGFHPVLHRRNRNFMGPAKHFTRTARPSKYYIIDFGLSIKYPHDTPNPRAIPIFGGDKSVPEFQRDPCGIYNPFPTDVYYLGNLIRKEFIQVRRLMILLSIHR